MKNITAILENRKAAAALGCHQHATKNINRAIILAILADAHFNGVGPLTTAQVAATTGQCYVHVNNQLNGLLGDGYVQVAKSAAVSRRGRRSYTWSI